MNEDSVFTELIILAILLLFSSFFSGTESAIFSLNRLERNALRKERHRLFPGIIPYLLDHQEQILVTILTGNMIVNIFASGLGEIAGDRLFGEHGELISIILMTSVLVLAGELTPKRIALAFSRDYTRFVSVPLYYFHILLTPLRKALTFGTRLLFRLLPSKTGSSVDNRHSIVLSTAELGYQRRILRQSEYHLFRSYVTFREKSAQSVMVPRSELKTVSRETSISEVLDLVQASPSYLVNSSIILFKEDNDHLAGWVPLSSLLERKFSGENLSDPISRLSRDFYTVPDSKELTILIAELRESDAEVVLLVDEYGGTAGVLWFRNIIEDVLKAFYTPHRQRLDESSKNRATIPGAMPHAELEELCGREINIDVETAAGLFLELYGEIPVPGDSVDYNGVFFQVLSMDGNRITELSVRVGSGA